MLALHTVDGLELISDSRTKFVVASVHSILGWRGSEKGVASIQMQVKRGVE
jgi:hypothetical protein